MDGKYVGKRDQTNIKNAKKNIYSLSKTETFLLDKEYRGLVNRRIREKIKKVF